MGVALGTAFQTRSFAEGPLETLSYGVFFVPFAVVYAIAVVLHIVLPEYTQDTEQVKDAIASSPRYHLNSRLYNSNLDSTSDPHTYRCYGGDESN